MPILDGHHSLRSDTLIAKRAAGVCFCGVVLFPEEGIKGIKSGDSEPTPLRDRQSLSDSMERIAK